MATEVNPRTFHRTGLVILDAKRFDRWLDPVVQEPLLVPYQGEDLAAYAISAWANSPRNHGPQCIELVAAG